MGLGRADVHSVNTVEEAADLDMALRLQAMDATLGAAEVPSNSTMAVEDTCGRCNEVSIALCPDNLCN